MLLENESLSLDDCGRKIQRHAQHGDPDFSSFQRPPFLQSLQAKEATELPPLPTSD
jgi:hypothetical protein